MNFPTISYNTINTLANNNIGCYIDVIYNGEKRIVVDKHFGDDTLCYIRDNYGEPVKINECQIIPKKNIRISLL